MFLEKRRKREAKRETAKGEEPLSSLLSLHLPPQITKEHLISDTQATYKLILQIVIHTFLRF